MFANCGRVTIPLSLCFLFIYFFKSSTRRGCTVLHSKSESLVDSASLRNSLVVQASVVFFLAFFVPDESFFYIQNLEVRMLTSNGTLMHLLYVEYICTCKQCIYFAVRFCIRSSIRKAPRNFLFVIPMVNSLLKNNSTRSFCKGTLDILTWLLEQIFYLMEVEWS